MNQELKNFFVTCPKGLESTLKTELETLFQEFRLPCEVHEESAGCALEGTWEHCMIANLCSRVASRVLFQVLHKQINHQNDIYDLTKELPWETYFSIEKTFVVHSHINSYLFNNSMYTSLKIKDALCDRFTEKTGQRPNVSKENTDISIHALIKENEFKLSIDTSGDSLFLRGYRLLAQEAPLKENLAASLLMMSSWEFICQNIFISSDPIYWKRPYAQEGQGKMPAKFLCAPFFMDIFCGSATLPIEAAMILQNKKPNAHRTHFSFLDIFPHEQSEKKALFFELKQKIKSLQKNKIQIKEAVLEYCKSNHIEIFGEHFIYGSDIQDDIVIKTKPQLLASETDFLIQIQSCDALLSKPIASHGIMIINPPYGERLHETSEVVTLYKSIGDLWKQKYKNWNTWILSSNKEALKNLGLRPTQKNKIFNGPLECLYEQFLLY